MTRGLRPLLVLALVLVGVAGCGTPAGPAGDPVEARHQTVLNEISEMYAVYIKTHQKPPQKVADLATPANKTINPLSTQAIQSEEYVVVWGTDLAGNDNAVLAYHKSVPKDGGFVLLCNGSIKQMSAAEFGSAPKVGKK